MPWVTDEFGGQYWVSEPAKSGGTVPAQPMPASAAPAPGYTPANSPYAAPANYDPVTYQQIAPGPQGQVARDANGVPIQSPRKTFDPWVDDLYSTAKTNDFNIQQKYATGVAPAFGHAQDLNMEGLQWGRFALDEQKANRTGYTNELNRIQGDTYLNAVNANANGQNIVARNRAQTDYLNGVDMGALGSFQQGMQGLRAPIQGSGPYQGIAADPEGLAAQRNALSMMGGIAGGSLDYQAAQAQAYMAQAYDAQAYMAEAALADTRYADLHRYRSNINDVNEQYKALEGIKGMVGGGEWNQNLRDVRDKAKGLSDPKITDQERLIMEQLRQQTEGQMRTNREGLGADLGARGIRSGASEQVGLGMYNQQVGQDRVLAELGAGANAVNRAQQNMNLWADASATGRQAELQAQGMYIDAAGQIRAMNDQVGMQNAEWANQNSMFNAGEYNATSRLNANNKTNVSLANATNKTNVSMTNATNRTNVSMTNANNQTNTSMFNAGQTNQARANNQATRLSGAQGYSTAATNLRNSNDAINMFNKDQEMVQTRHIDNFNLADATRRQGVENDLLSGTLQTTGQVGSRSYADNALGLGENDRGWQRNQAANDRATGNADRTYGAGQDWVSSLQGFGGMTQQTGLNKAGLAAQDQGVYLGGVSTGFGQLSDSAKLAAGTEADKRALAMAEKAIQADPGGLLGTGILGKNGILGIKKFPIL